VKADLIENILIPSIKEYQQPHDFQINPKSPEYEIHKDHRINRVVTTLSLLRDTLDTYVEEEEWMYATGVSTVIQAMPTEVIYWQEIGDGNWLLLDLWPTTARNKSCQKMQTMNNILKSGTGHVAYSRYHFFNTRDRSEQKHKHTH
jgi:hypothetical protein